jgi:hypothetical protein
MEILFMSAVIVIGLWPLVAMGKLIQTLSAMNRTLWEIKEAVLEKRV